MNDFKNLLYLSIIIILDTYYLNEKDEIMFVAGGGNHITHLLYQYKQNFL